MNAPAPTSLDGILLIDKPAGCTSHDVVARVRRILGIKKVGHAGTLDPLATGLLILLVGKATKASQYLISLSKEYEGSFKLGETTDSQDSDGTVMLIRPVPAELDSDQLQAKMREFIGDQYQTPPMYSAKKVNGQPLYKMARKGEEIEREARFIHVAAFDLKAFSSPSGDFRVACSKGTYVRTLIHDLGEKIGSGAHMTALRRTAIDRFHISKAVTLETLEGMPAAEQRRLLIPVYQVIPSHALA